MKTKTWREVRGRRSPETEVRLRKVTADMRTAMRLADTRKARQTSGRRPRPYSLRLRRAQ